MDQARLCSFRVMEKWIQHLFLAHSRSQPAGFSQVSLTQLIECDKQLFIKASNELVGSLSAEPGQPKPLDAVIERLQASAELAQFLLPMPKSSSQNQPSTAAPKRKHESEDTMNPATKRPKGQGKGKSKTKGKGKNHEYTPGNTITLPPGCVPKTPDNKPLCFGFNKGICKFRGSGPRCARGNHLCYKQGCHKPKPFHECTHTQ